jgi:TldD protein
VTSDRAHGAGVRVFDGLSAYYATTNDTSPEGLIRAAKQAAAAISNARRQKSAPLDVVVSPAPFPVKDRPGDVPGARKAQLLHAACKAARAEGEAIKQVIASLSDAETDVLIANSEGVFASDRRTYTRLGVQAVASDNSGNQTGFQGPGMHMGYEMFETLVDPEKAARIAAKTALTMLTAPLCPAGVMPVAIESGFGGVIFHEACGHSLEATSVALGNSEFCGKLGTKIASDVVTAVDDGTLPGEWGSIKIDDEGTPANRLVLIENGILKNYMVDKLNARRMGLPVTGSSRRQSYAFAPTSRMRNTFIAPGETEDAEIIATMGDGLYAARMGGGSVNPATGEFNFAVSEGYWVKDGKIDHPVRGATLIGRGGQVLMRIDRVGKHLRLSQGMCGSVSGSVPVTVGQPLIRVTEMTVGGR